MQSLQHWRLHSRREVKSTNTARLAHRIILVDVADSVQRVRIEQHRHLDHVGPACFSHQRTLDALLGDEVLLQAKVSDKNSKGKVKVVRNRTVKRQH